MPSKFSKISKYVQKKKGVKATALHENSRDAKRLRRAGARDDRVNKTHAVKEKTNRKWIDRVLFFQDKLPETLHPFEVDEIKSLVQEYLARNDEELETLKAERRQGRPPSTRQVLLEQARSQDEKELETGFWVPNLTDAETLVKLDAWKGNWATLAVMHYIRIDRNGVVRESRFPPRGTS